MNKTKKERTRLTSSSKPKASAIVESMESLSLYRLMVESVRDYAIVLLDADGFVISWNTGAERIKGYSDKEIIGKHFSIFYLDEDRERRHPQEELAIAKRNGRYEEEGWRVRKDGSRFWASVVITALRNSEGRLVGFGKVTRDLTERRNTLMALRESEERARLVYGNVKDYMIISLDPKGIITSWNEGARRIEGYEAVEIIGKHFSAFYPPEDVAVGKCEYELVEASTTGRFEDEGWRVRKDGTKFWANVVITAIYSDNGELRGFSKISRDMTEKKRGEDRLRMSNESLERRVQSRTEELERTNRNLRDEIENRKRIEAELQKAVVARDEFLSVASHELRTPLTPLKLQVQRLMNHLRRDDGNFIKGEQFSKMAGSTERSINRLSNLIDSMLDVGRIDSGQMDLYPEDFDAVESVREMAHRAQMESVGSSIRVHGDEKVAVHLDKMRFEQVATNLLSNAIKYGDHKPIDVTVTKVRDRIEVRVKDQGLGISPQDMGRIFRRFERLSSPSTARGLGLGLYITREILRAQGGDVHVISEPGKGSEFIFDLPLVTAEGEIENA